MLIDSHCHLDYPPLADEIDAVVARAEAAGIGLILTIATTLSGFERVRALAERFAHVYCTVGVHPHEAGRELGEDRDRLIALAAHPKVVGIGETGLDYYYDHSPRAAQRQAFRAHLEVAQTTGLPVIVHSRDADDDTAEILEEAGRRAPLGGVLHCFSSGKTLAERALALGFYISFSGIVTFKKADAVRAVAKLVPDRRILVETDAPYLAPVPHRGKTNEPSFIVHTARALAALRGVSPDRFASLTTDNFLRLFNKIPATIPVNCE